MQVKNVLLTGAGGKIGRAVLPHLTQAGYRVRALEYTDGLQVPHTDNVEVVVGDLRDPSLAKQLIEDMDVVVHMANVKENKELFLDTNIKGTFYLLDAVKESKNVQQFIQAGSDARAGIYYYPHPIPIDENHRHSGYPGYYPLSKVLEEVMCEQYRIMYQTPITVLRFSWVHDEDDILAHVTLKEPNLGVPVWRDWAVTPEQRAFFDGGEDAVACLVHADGSAGKRHIVGIQDVVDSILLAIGNPSAVGEAFNVSGPAPFSYDVLADYLAEKLNLPVVRFEVGEFHDFCIDMAKSRSVLGLNPQYDIFRIADDALQFRAEGRTRSECLYPG